jgi:HEAT repeat protein
MFSFDVLASVAATLLLVWLAFAAWIVVARMKSDRLVRRRTTDGRRLIDGVDSSRWRWRRLLRVADGDPGPDATAAAEVLVRRDSARLLRMARGSSHRRAHALRLLVRGGFPHGFFLLRLARGASSRELTAAVVAIAAEQESAEADELLLDILVVGDHPRSRTATELAPRGARVADRVLVLCSHEEPEVRYWALMLLRGVATDSRVRAAAVAGATDPVGSVRAAAARVLGSSRSPDVQPAVRALLSDEVFFVRAHAARAAGEIGAGQLAGEVAALLTDRNWWVRAAAKESLLRLGAHGLAAASAMLDDEDAFARDGAGEVIAAFRFDRQALELAG